MVRVKTFLGCIQLETGGTCLGWFFFATFLIFTALFFVFGLLNIIAKPHPLYTLIWLDIIIYLIIVIYSSWLMTQGIKCKNPSKIQPFRLISIASCIFFFCGFFYLIYKKFTEIEVKPKETGVIGISYERDIFDKLEQDYDILKIILTLLFFFASVYIFIFVDSLHKSVREFRRRFYIVAKL